MAVPKSKISKSRRGQRRSHDKLGQPHFQEDATTGELVRRHHVDLKTGMYKGKQIVEPKGDL